MVRMLIGLRHPPGGGHCLSQFQSCYLYISAFRCLLKRDQHKSSRRTFLRWFRRFIATVLLLLTAWASSWKFTSTPTESFHHGFFLSDHDRFKREPSLFCARRFVGISAFSPWAVYRPPIPCQPLSDWLQLAYIDFTELHTRCACRSLKADVLERCLRIPSVAGPVQPWPGCLISL